MACCTQQKIPQIGRRPRERMQRPAGHLGPATSPSTTTGVVAVEPPLVADLKAHVVPQVHG